MTIADIKNWLEEFELKHYHNSESMIHSFYYGNYCHFKVCGDNSIIPSIDLPTVIGLHEVFELKNELKEFCKILVTLKTKGFKIYENSSVTLDK